MNVIESFDLWAVAGVQCTRALLIVATYVRSAFDHGNGGGGGPIDTYPNLHACIVGVKVANS